ncbi:hypothetical protein MVLG_02348 [Microbotryum lychnidis-dioicae p1A1 Lamole]|uniref:Uncharacterized protein n=1 Tax=Microbotryum lychnidis-dioicae (strain p1A1 Lamole / MvSl-1064) TaxID=683840 RepID=U5H4W3_USTV1|nr:hypothetical protein MVLG_02348 [Microbotryum lychnidis-dioicae p1A1 Lamole]|eukprot:KDE07301.1 hypothetical protein MVLG_02348 [Microbotryum lychnidis-dioicae p1A1 Lamole]
MPILRRPMRRSLVHELQTRGSLYLGLLHFSVLRRVQTPVLLFTLYAGAIHVLLQWYEMPRFTSGASSVVATLNLVLALLVSFRSSSSYDRWYEGRRQWASLQSTSRTILRLFHFSLPPPAASPTGSAIMVQQHSKVVNELCALVCAFAYATMYHLRDEPGVDHPELQRLIPPSLLRAYKETPRQLRRDPSIDGSNVHHSTASETTRALEGLNTAPYPTDALPFALLSGAPSNLPLSLIRAIHGYLNAFHATPLASAGSPNPQTPAVDGPTYANGLSAIRDFSDQLTALERIRDTPIPLVLEIQLQFLLLVYVAAVPLQCAKLGIWSIPVTAVAAAVFYGVDRAAEELSDPFGIEPNDLPLAKLCAGIHREYIELVGAGTLSGSYGNEWVPSLSRKES